MKTFAHPDQAGHTPSFFLQRGRVRRNFEIPERAAALEAALHRMGLAPATPGPLAPGALEAVHRADYLDFLATAAADWAKLPEPGPEVVANIHPAPEMVAQGGRNSANILSRAGWYTADAGCPIGPGSWDAIQGLPPAPWPRRRKPRRATPPTRSAAHLATTPMPRAPAAIAT